MSDVSDFLAPMVGIRFAGGCDQCDALAGDAPRPRHLPHHDQPRRRLPGLAADPSKTRGHTMTSRTPPGRQNDARWKAAKAQAVRDSGGICQLCGNPLDPSAPRNTPNTTEIDHIIGLNQGGDPFDRGNLRAVHRWCHQRRDKATPAAVHATPVWVPPDPWVNCPTCPNPCSYAGRPASRCW